jgi:Pyruvate/2-oxoacid:ferredoxin oxidoreductase delta subunit
LTIIDMKELAMLRLSKRTNEHVVSFCERCGSVCGSVCRAEAIREHARQRALAYGWRQV